jgi:hypothetical protein
MSDLATALRILLAAALLLPGCHTSRSAPGDGASPGDDGTAPGDAVAGVMCTGTSGVFPTFDKTCTIAEDCVIGIHQTNCCGATIAIGLTKAEQPRFAAAEAQCVAQYPPCACPTTPTVAEDGRNPIAGQSIVVECQSRKCMTTVK